MFDNPGKELKRLQNELLAAENRRHFDANEESFADIQNILHCRENDPVLDENYLPGSESFVITSDELHDPSAPNFSVRAIRVKKRKYRTRYRLILSILIIENLLLVVNFLWHWIPE